MPIVTSNPDVLGGSLVFDGTRVPRAKLIRLFGGWDSIQEFIEGFPTVSSEQVRLFLQNAKIAIEDKAVL